MAPHTPRCSERPGEPVALFDHPRAHRSSWGAPRWPPSLFKRRGLRPPRTPPADARSAPGNPWRSSIIRVLIDRRGGPRDGPPASSSEGGYAPLGLPRPTLGAPRGTRGAPRSSACSSIVVGGPEMAPQPLQAKGATPPSDSPGRRSERPGEPVALLDHPRAHRSSWGAPRWPPSLFKRRGLRPPRTPPADARSAPGNPWRSSIIRVLIDRRGGPRDGPPASSSEGGYAPLGLPRPTLGAPRGTRGAPRSSACSSIVVGGPEMAPQPLQAKGATPPSDSPGRRSERPGEPVALLDHPRAHRSSWGAPRWPPSLFKRRGLRPPRTPPADARSAPGNPWRSSIIRVLIDRRGGPRDGPPASSSEGGYAPLGLPRPTLGAPRGTRGAPRSSACSSIVVGGPEMAPQPLQAKGATPPSDSPGRCSERPGEPVALLDLPRAHRSSWGAPRWPPTPPDARPRPGGAVARLGVDTGCLIAPGSTPRR